MSLAPDVTLGQLLSRPPEELVDEIPPVLPHGLYEMATGHGPPESGLTPRQVHYALCKSLGAHRDARPDKVRFVDHDPDCATLSLREHLRRMTEPQRGYGETTWLSEFAASAACEQRPSRQPPAEPDGEHSPGRSFRALFDRLNQPLGWNCHSIASRAGWCVDEETLASEAWARTFQAYWSPRSRVRFLGRIKILTMLINVARREVWKVQRHRRTIDLDTVPEIPARPTWTEDETRRWESRLGTCVDSLPPKCAIVWYLHYQRRLVPAEIAAHLGVGRPVVSEHLTRARTRLAECLTRSSDDAGGFEA